MKQIVQCNAQRRRIFPGKAYHFCRLSFKIRSLRTKKGMAMLSRVHTYVKRLSREVTSPSPPLLHRKAIPPHCFLRGSTRFRYFRSSASHLNSDPCRYCSPQSCWIPARLVQQLFPRRTVFSIGRLASHFEHYDLLKKAAP